MEERRWQGPYPETIEKATTLNHAVINQPSGVVMNKVTGQLVIQSARFYVALGQPEKLKIVSSDDTYRILRIARWIDALPENVRFIYAYRINNRVFVDAVVPHDVLFYAEAESASRGETEIYW